MTHVTQASMVLMTVAGKDGPPSRAEAARQLGVEPGHVDVGYGVVAIDPGQGLYAVLVRSDRLPPGQTGQPYGGPFSNPKIRSFDS
jgi:hypothetical protein